MSQTTYQGHTETSGGLQGHSIGDSYPFIVIGTGLKGEYRLHHTIEGTQGPRQPSYAEALADIRRGALLQ